MSDLKDDIERLSNLKPLYGSPAEQAEQVEQEVMYCHRSDGAYIGEWREDGFHLDTSVVAPPEQQEQEGERPEDIMRMALNDEYRDRLWSHKEPVLISAVDMLEMVKYARTLEACCDRYAGALREADKIAKRCGENESQGTFDKALNDISDIIDTALTDQPDSSGGE